MGDGVKAMPSQSGYCSDGSEAAGQTRMDVEWEENDETLFVLNYN